MHRKHASINKQRSFYREDVKTRSTLPTERKTPNTEKKILDRGKFENSTRNSKFEFLSCFVRGRLNLIGDVALRKPETDGVVSWCTPRHFQPFN